MSDVFGRVVCGVDHSDAGEAAARAAARVADPNGSLTLISVDDPSIAVHAGLVVVGSRRLVRTRRAQPTEEGAR